MTNIKSYLAELRAPFLTVTIIPVITGAVLAHRQGAHFNLWFFCLLMAAFISLHLGTNVLNDYFDHINGTDNINKKFISPFTGGSRLIQKNALSPEKVFAEGVILFVMGAIFFLPLIIKFGFPMAAVLAVSLVSGIFYTAPPFKWAHLGLGEVLIFICFGPLMVLPSFYTQGGSGYLAPALISITIGMLAAAIVDINQFPDFEADSMTGKRNLIVRLGLKAGRLTYVIMIVFSFAAIAAAVALRAVPPATLLALLAVPLAMKAVFILNENYYRPEKLAPACGITILTHLTTGIIILIVLFFTK